MINSFRLIPLLAVLFSVFFHFKSSAQTVDLTELKRELNKNFSPADFNIDQLQTKSEEGDLFVASGNVTFFGLSNIQCEAKLNKSTKKPHSFKVIFPANSKFNIGKIAKIAGRKVGATLPSTLTQSPNLQFQELNIQFGVDGKLSNGHLLLVATEWDIVNMSSFKLKTVQVRVEFTSSSAGGTITANFNIGSVNANLQAQLSSSKALIFSGELSGSVNLQTLFNSTIGATDAQTFFNMMPSPVVKNIQLPNMAFEIKPKEKKLWFSGQTSAGMAGIEMKSLGSKKIVTMEMQPPNVKDVIGNTFLDPLAFESPFLVATNMPNPKYNSRINKNIKGIKLTKGVNMISQVDMGSDYAKIFKTSKLYLSGGISTSKEISLTAQQKLNYTIVENKVKLEGIAFDISSSPKPEMGMSGVLSVKVDNETTLLFNAGIRGGFLPINLQGDIQMDVSNGAMWKNPFGVPYIGIKGLKGGIGVSPVFPSFISKLSLGGDIEIGKTLGSSKNIKGRVYATLDLANIMSSSLDIKVVKLSVASFINAFSDTPLTGELQKILGTGIDKAQIQVFPKEKRFFAMIGVDIFGVKANMEVGVKNTNVYAEGSIAPFKFPASGFTVLSIQGINGGPATVKIQVGSDPSLRIQGKAMLFESIALSADVNISRSGFNLKGEGNLFNGGFKASVEVKGENLKSSSPSIYAKIEMSQEIIGKVKTELNGWIEKTGKQNREDIERVKNGINTGTFLDVLAKESLGAVQKMSTEMATMGQLVVDNAIPDVKRIYFEGDISPTQSSFKFYIVVAVGGKELDPIGITLDLKGDVGAQVLKIFNAIKAQVLETFKQLGEDLKKAAESFKEFVEDVAKVAVQAVEYAGKAIKEVTKALSKIWDGPDLPAAKDGPALASLAPGYRHYKISVTSIKCTYAMDKRETFGGAISSVVGDIGGDDAFELYGLIYTLGNGMTTTSKTNDVAFSKNRTQAKSYNASSPAKSINSTKHFYVRNGANHGVTFGAYLLEKETGASYASDASRYVKSPYISLNSWNWDAGGSKNGNFEWTHTEGRFTIYYKITLVKKIGEQDMKNQIASRSVANVQAKMKLGGDLKSGCLLNPAIKNKDGAMLSFLLANKSKVCSSDISLALNPSYYNRDIASRLILSYKGQLSNEYLTKAITIKKTGIVTLLIEKGMVPKAEHLNLAIDNNAPGIVKLLVLKKVPVTKADLVKVVNKGSVLMTKYLMFAGARPDIQMLNSSITNSKPNLTMAFLKYLTPDYSSLQAAAKKNKIKLFKLLLDKGAKVTGNECALTAIKKSNIPLLELNLASGANAETVMKTAISSNNLKAIESCLSYGASSDQVLSYSIQNSNVALYEKLLLQYGANSTKALGISIEKNKYEYAVTALKLGADPNMNLKSEADKGRDNYVKLLVENGGNPSLGITGSINNNKADLLRYLINRGADGTKDADLNLAIGKKSLPMTQLLVENGANPNAGIKKAVGTKNYEIIEYLLSYGASPIGHISQASKEGDLKLVKILLKYGANPSNGIKSAVHNNKMIVAEALLIYGASPKGMLPKASEYGSLKIVRMLLERGENPNEGIKIAVKRNHTNVSLLLLDYSPSIKGLIAISSGHGNNKLVNRLLKMGANPQNGMENSVKHDHLSTAKILLKAGANVKHGKHIKHAVKNTNLEMLTLMLENGSDFMYIDKDGNSFLHQAAGIKEQVTMVNIFIEKGVDVNLKNTVGNAPLHIAVRVKGKEQLPTVMSLHQAGADLNALNEKDKTVRKIARNQKVKKYLKENGALKKIKKAK